VPVPVNDVHQHVTVVIQLNSAQHAIKAAFHYSSQLQTWSKTWSQLRKQVETRTHVESQLKTCLKRVFSTFHLCSTRTNQRPGFQQKSLKLVESKPARTCRKPGYKPGRKPGLQLARIMECGLYFINSFNCLTSHAVTSANCALCSHLVCNKNLLLNQQ